MGSSYLTPVLVYFLTTFLNSGNPFGRKDHGSS